MFRKESGSENTKDFIKVPGKSALSESLDHSLKHLDTSLSNDLEVTRSSCYDPNCSGGSDDDDDDWLNDHDWLNVPNNLQR